jgi:hypothetical protein
MPMTANRFNKNQLVPFSREKNTHIHVPSIGDPSSRAESSLRARHLQAGLVSLVILAFTCAAVTFAQRLQSDSNQFWVIVHEGQTDISPRGRSVSNCALIFPDGRFHVERRVQELPGSTAALKIFDSSLDSTQLQHLKTVLDSEGIRRLPPYEQPILPMGVPWSYGFNARITRPTGVQNVGYWTWRDGVSTASPNSSPENVKKGWRLSETELRPLVDWLRSIEHLKLVPSEGRSDTLCKGEDDGGTQ